MALSRFKLDPSNKIDKGAHGAIYRVSPRQVMKVFWKKWDPEGELLEKEFRVISALYQEGVLVPKPKDIDVIYDPRYNVVRRGLLMEYIPGVEINNKSYPAIKRQGYIEIEKAQRLGFCPAIDALKEENLIWSLRRGKVYLIDFAAWGEPKGERK